jgi:hypothetical protein
MLPSAIAFVAGLLVVGMSVPDTRPRSLTTAMIRAWTSPHRDRGNHS